MELIEAIERAKLITTHCNEVLNNCNLYCQEVKINFCVDDVSEFRNTINASVKKRLKSRHEYDVVIYAGLIEFLYHKIDDDVLSIFFNFKINEQRDTFKIFIFDIWVYLVSFHEYGHIISGHLQYMNSNQWLEFDEKNSSLNNIRQEYSYTMELEADAWSGQLCLSYLAEYYKNINVCLCRDENDSKIWDDFCLMIIILMYLFKENSNKTHPPTLSRTLANLMFIHDTVKEKSELQKMLPDSSHLTPEYINNNLVKYLLRDMENAFKNFSKDLEIVSSTKSNIEKMGLSKFRLTKENF